MRAGLQKLSAIVSDTFLRFYLPYQKLEIEVKLQYQLRPTVRIIFATWVIFLDFLFAFVISRSFDVLSILANIFLWVTPVILIASKILQHIYQALYGGELLAVLQRRKARFDNFYIYFLLISSAMTLWLAGPPSSFKNDPVLTHIIAFVGGTIICFLVYLAAVETIKVIGMTVWWPRTLTPATINKDHLHEARQVDEAELREKNISDER